MPKLAYLYFFCTFNVFFCIKLNYFLCIMIILIIFALLFCAIIKISILYLLIMKKLFFSFFFFIFSITIVKAVPAYPGLLTKAQSDGSVVSYYLYGDENFGFSSSEDGYLIALNDAGIFEYAELNDQYEIVPVGIKVSNLDQRTVRENRYLKNALKISDLSFQLGQLEKIARENAQQRVRVGQGAPVKRYPLKGEPTSLVILVNFQDVAFTSATPQVDFTALLNQEGYSANDATGSARDFFRASSNNIFNPRFVVVGPYTLPKEMAYYGKDYGEGSLRNENFASQMIIDACKAADVEVDFSEYDTDDDGYVDNVFVYYAGYNQAEGADENTVWPHRSEIYTKQNFDGVLLRDYACTSELKGSGKNGAIMCGIGTFCHEFGHVLGLPDLYVTDYGHNNPTLGSWDAMDNGPYNNGGKTPPSYSSYERFFLGWLTPTILEAGKVEIGPLLTSNSAYILAKETPNLDGANPNPNEFFMIENRQKIGWDSVGLPGEGLLITHVDYNKSAWENNTPNNDPNDMGVQIVCASSDTRSPAYNTFPGLDNITTCYFEMKDGYKFPEPLTSIFKIGNGNISFIYGETDTTPYVKKDLNIDYFETEYKSPISRQVKFTGHHIAGKEIEFVFKSGTNFKIKSLDKETYSRGAKIAVSEDSTFECTLEILFDPRKITEKDELIEDLLQVKADNYTNYYTVTGKSNKPLNVKKPEVLSPTEVGKDAFTANWVEQDKATCYYVSVYSIADANSSDLEKFDTFSEDNMPEGWTSTFYEASTLYKSSAPLSVIFKNAVDTLWTKEYFLDVDKITMWVHSQNTIGTLYVDGFVNGSWVNVLKKNIDTSVRKTEVSAELGNNKCRKFKIYYIKSKDAAGGLCLDDFEAISYTSPNFIFEEYEVYNSGFRVTNLKNDRYYYYRVKASDKNLNVAVDKNETISPLSDPMRVSLQGYVSVDNVKATVEELIVEYSSDGSNNVFVDLGEQPTENSTLYIYAVDGRLLEALKPTTQRVCLNNLLENNVYILKYSVGDINAINKVGKVIK